MIVQIEKKELREQIMNACIEQQQLLMDDFSQRIKTLLADQEQQNMLNLANSKQLILQQYFDEVDLLNDALIFAQLEMNRLQYLQSVNHMNHREVELGAIVVTDAYTIFVSSTVDPFRFHGENVLCISTESTLFSKMKGKKKGEMFLHDRKAYVIRDVF